MTLTATMMAILGSSLLLHDFTGVVALPICVCRLSCFVCRTVFCVLSEPTSELSCVMLDCIEAIVVCLVALSAINAAMVITWEPLSV